MRFAPSAADSGYLIQAYDIDRVRIAGHDYLVSLAVSARQIVPDWGPTGVADLRPEHLDALLTLEPQVILLGTGRRQRFPDARIYSAVLARGIGVEIMDTGAACRTYNILVGEGRPVAAGLILD